MAQPKTESTQAPTPVSPEKRLADSEISISLCDPDDVDRIAEGMYTCFSNAWWDKMEPPELRPASQTTRQNRLAARLRLFFLNPHMHWVKATLASSGEIIGVAGWVGPGNAVHNLWRRSAPTFYGWRETLSPAEYDEMWEGVSPTWDEELERNDEERKALMGDEPHWYLAPVFTFPEFQGRGVAGRLMEWAIRRADATVPVTPLYLESAPTAREVYAHLGFVPQGATNFIRRGPGGAEGVEGAGGRERVDEEKETGHVLV